MQELNNQQFIKKTPNTEVNKTGKLIIGRIRNRLR